MKTKKLLSMLLVVSIMAAMVIVPMSASAQGIWVPCESCGGTGYDSSEICTVCNGTKMASCPMCDGHGTVDMGMGPEMCVECWGSGVSTCFSCQGTGYEWCMDCLSDGGAWNNDYSLEAVTGEKITNGMQSVRDYGGRTATLRAGWKNTGKKLDGFGAYVCNWSDFEDADRDDSICAKYDNEILTPNQTFSVDVTGIDDFDDTIFAIPYIIHNGEVYIFNENTLSGTVKDTKIN